MISTPVKAVIFDIRDVLSSSTPNDPACFAPRVFEILNRPHTPNELICNQREDNQNAFSNDEVDSSQRSAKAVSQMAVTDAESANLNSHNSSLLATMKKVKAERPDVRLYVTSDLPSEEWETARSEAVELGIFNEVSTSFELGTCKPELRFFRHLLQCIRIPPHETLLVDSNCDNTLAAQSLGFKEAITIDESALWGKLLSVLEGPAQRARAWLQSKSKNLHSETSTGHIIRDNFAQLLLHEVIGDEELLDLKRFDRTWNYFIDSPWGTTKQYPNDVDTTSYALKLLSSAPGVTDSVMDELLSLGQTSADGIVKVYFDETRPRVDPAVCLNVIRLFFRFDRGHQKELEPTKRWVQDVLYHRAYLNGTRYYQSPDTFLYFYARLLLENPHSDVSRDEVVLRERLIERVNGEGDAMSLAMRVLACHFVGIRNELDLKRLLDKQQEDGSFAIGWLCQYGKTQMKLGNRALTTALAIRAIEVMR